jgi:hypothetical protein
MDRPTLDQYGLKRAPGPPPEWKSLLTLPSPFPFPFACPPDSSSSSSHSSSSSSSPGGKKGNELVSPEGRRESCSAEQSDKASNKGDTPSSVILTSGKCQGGRTFSICNENSKFSHFSIFIFILHSTICCPCGRSGTIFNLTVQMSADITRCGRKGV